MDDFRSQLKRLTESVQHDIELEYHYVVNYRRAYTIVATLLSLVGGVFFLTHSLSSWSNFYGMACFVLFCYILFGSPIDRKLTPESEQRVMEYVREMIAQEKSDDDTNRE